MLINLCRHEMSIVGSDNKIIEVLPGKGDDRIWCDLEEELIASEEVSGRIVPIVQEQAKNIRNLPEPEDGTYYIVPRIVAIAAYDRDDLVYPHEIRRNLQGAVIACRKLRVP